MRRFMITVAIVIGGMYYVKNHYSRQDVLAYTKANPDSSMSPMLEYYVAMTYYTREEYEPSAKAFDQLLAIHPTCQYAPLSLVRMGDSYEQLRDWDKAREAYEKYLEQFPEDKHHNLVQGKYNMIRFRK